MKVRSNIKAGETITHVKVFDGRNHNEKLMDDSNGSVKTGKSCVKKLNLKKETIRELSESEMKQAVGGTILASTTTSANCDSATRPKI